MILLRDLLTRMQDQPTGCIAVLTVRLTDGTVVDAYGDDAANRDRTGLALRALFATDDAALQTPAPGAGSDPRKCIVLAHDRTYVCQRLHEAPEFAIAAVCRNDGNLGLAVTLLRQESGR